ncbi:hypothetical protein BDR07DRAFT_1396377, partial [Suillus spraguei]
MGVCHPRLFLSNRAECIFRTCTDRHSSDTLHLCEQERRTCYDERGEVSQRSDRYPFVIGR